METEDEMATDSAEGSVYHVPIKTDPSPPSTQPLGHQAQTHDPMTTTHLSPLPSASPSHPTPGGSAPPKKRKPRGQEIPDPKALLPPGKRAKTEEEKEQRRVERLLRNRKAAEASRGRKRAEMDGLERKVEEQGRVIEELNRRNLELEALLVEERARFLKVEE